MMAKHTQSVEIVKISHFGTKNVDDHVVRIDQHPVGRRKAFDSNVLAKSLLDLVAKLNGHGRDLAGRTAGGDHHVISDVRLSSERNRHDLLSLIVIKRL